MSDPLDHVSAHTPLAVRAATWNLFCDAARDFRARKAGRIAAPAITNLIHPANTVLVRNDTGGSLPDPFRVLALGEPLVSAVDRPLAFQERPALAGTTPAAADDAVAILLEPAPAGAVVKAVVAGLVVCEVDVTDAAHEYARPIPGNTFRLASATDGPARVLWHEAGTGHKVAVVLLGPGHGPVGFFARLTTRDPSSPNARWNFFRQRSNGITLVDVGTEVTGYLATVRAIDGTDLDGEFSGLIVWMIPSLNPGYYECTPIPYATAVNAGLVSTTSQEFKGPKSFIDTLTAETNFVANSTAGTSPRNSVGEFFTVSATGLSGAKQPALAVNQGDHVWTTTIGVQNPGVSDLRLNGGLTSINRNGDTTLTTEWASLTVLASATGSGSDPGWVQLGLGFQGGGGGSASFRTSTANNLVPNPFAYPDGSTAQGPLKFLQLGLPGDGLLPTTSNVGLFAGGFISSNLGYYFPNVTFAGNYGDPVVYNGRKPGINSTVAGMTFYAGGLVNMGWFGALGTSTVNGLTFHDGLYASGGGLTAVAHTDVANTFTVGPNTFQSGGAGTVAVIVQGAPAQTAPLQVWSNSGGTGLTQIRADGGVTTNTTTVNNVVNTTTVNQVFNTVSSQTANVVEVRDPSNNVLTSLGPDGAIYSTVLNTTTVNMTLQTVTSQTSNLIEITDPTNTVIASVGAAADMHGFRLRGGTF